MPNYAKELNNAYLAVAVRDKRFLHTPFESLFRAAKKLVDSLPDEPETPTDPLIYIAKIIKRSDDVTDIAELNAYMPNFLQDENGATIDWEISTKWLKGNLSSLQGMYASIFVTMMSPPSVTKITAWVNNGACYIYFDDGVPSYAYLQVQIIQQNPTGSAPPLYNLEEQSATLGPDGDSIEVLFSVNLLPFQMALLVDSFTFIPSNTVVGFSVDETNNKILRLNLDTSYDPTDHITLIFDGLTDLISYQYVDCAAFEITVNTGD